MGHRGIPARTLIAAYSMACLFLAAPTASVSAQESCEETLHWTRGVAVRIGHSRAQAEMDAARFQARAQRLEGEIQQLREEITRLRSVEPKKEK